MTDILARDDVRKALITGDLRSLAGSTLAALSKRGLLARIFRQVTSTRYLTMKPHWYRTNAGVEMGCRFAAEDAAALVAKREAAGTVVVPRWVAEAAVRSMAPKSEARIALEQVLAVNPNTKEPA